MSGYGSRAEGVPQTAERDLGKRLETTCWGLFLIMIGGIWLVPGEQVPEGTWLIGTGLIMLGLNIARYGNGIKMSGFTVVLGTLALLSGVGDFLAIDLPLLAILLILLGSKLLLEPLLEKKGD